MSEVGQVHTSTACQPITPSIIVAALYLPRK